MLTSGERAQSGRRASSERMTNLGCGTRSRRLTSSANSNKRAPADQIDRGSLTLYAEPREWPAAARPRELRVLREPGGGDTGRSGRPDGTPASGSARQVA